VRIYSLTVLISLPGGDSSFVNIVMSEEDPLNINLETGHFYFGKNGTFLNWLDIVADFC
jgi:hypothetical protein